MSVATKRAIPAGGIACVSQGRCGDSTGWHHANSDAARKCASLAETLRTSTDRMRTAVAVGRERDANPAARDRKPLRKLEIDEMEILESMKQTALRFMPFYAHMAYKVRPVAVDEPPTVGRDGKPHYEIRAAITEDWRLLVNFGWVRDQFEQAYQDYGEKIREGLRAEGLPVNEPNVRAACETAANLQMSKVLLHELGHAMYNTWEYSRVNNLDSKLMNMAEDAVINNGLRALGAARDKSTGLVSIPNENINGEFLANAVYGGNVECDHHGHSWSYTDPESGETTKRCCYEETTAHYYAALSKMKEEQQKSQQGSQGDNDNDDAPEAGKGNAPGERKGQEGGSDRERSQGGQQSSDPAGGDQSGGGGQEPTDAPDDMSEGGNGDSKTGNNSGDDPLEDTGCGHTAAEKYRDDPLEKGTVSESQKRVSLDVTAQDIETWAENNAQQAKNIGFGAGSMARKWAAHRRRSDNIRWDAVLSSTVRRTIESLKSSRDTYSRVRRRDVAMGGVIRRGTKAGYMPSIAVAIDTSGSMNQEDLFMAYNSTRSVIKRTGITHVNAFAVDSEAKSAPVKIHKAEDLAPILKGGGGTDMCAGIETAAANGDDVCIVFTDGEVPWGKMQQRPRHIPAMQVIVAVIADGDAETERLTGEVPSWMKTVKINKEMLQRTQARSDDDTYVG